MYFYYTHYSILVILLLIIYFPIYEFNTNINILQSFVESYKVNFITLNSTINEKIYLTKANKLINLNYIDNIYNYNNYSLDLLYSNNTINIENNNSKNEFFIIWSNYFSKLYQIIFISIKIQNIIVYFLVYLSIIILIFNYYLYRKKYKSNKIFFYNYLIY